MIGGTHFNASSNSLVKKMLFMFSLQRYCSLLFSVPSLQSARDHLPGRLFLNSVHSFISSSQLLIGFVSDVVINNSVHFTKRKNYVVLKLFEDPKLVSTIDSFIPFSISEFNHLLIIDFNFKQTNLLCRIFTNPKNPVCPIVRHFYIDLLNIKCSIYRLCLD